DDAARELHYFPTRRSSDLTAIRKVVSILTHEEHGVLASMDEIQGVGHRVVHGGESFSSSVIVTLEVKQEIRRLFDLAPLHNPAQDRKSTRLNSSHVKISYA